ncbi:MAG: thioesterase family protein [Gammaproteobacteria bacterium]|nr:thioesterase family protein [Gammaproteobacteria bacterium]
MSFVETFCGVGNSNEEAWTFEIDQRFNGAFGGTNGGVLSAISVHVARQQSGRRAASIDSRYIRGFRPGTARVVSRLVNKGRTLTVMDVDIVDAQDRLCTHSVVTLVEPSALAVGIQHRGPVMPPDIAIWEDGKPWRAPSAPMVIPLIETFEPTALGGGDSMTITGTRVVWRESGTSAEAACIAADISVGPPVARAVRSAAATPNPDLSLRFCGSSDPAEFLAACCTLRTIDGGLASTSIDVWNGADLIAVGVSTTTCLPIPSG